MNQLAVPMQDPWFAVVVKGVQGRRRKLRDGGVEGMWGGGRRQCLLHCHNGEQKYESWTEKSSDHVCDTNTFANIPAEELVTGVAANLRTKRNPLATRAADYTLRSWQSSALRQ